MKDSTLLLFIICFFDLLLLELFATSSTFAISGVSKTTYFITGINNTVRNHVLQINSSWVGRANEILVDFSQESISNIQSLTIEIDPLALPDLTTSVAGQQYTKMIESIKLYSMNDYPTQSLPEVTNFPGESITFPTTGIGLKLKVHLHSGISVGEVDINFNYKTIFFYNQSSVILDGINVNKIRINARAANGESEFRVTKCRCPVPGLKSSNFGSDAEYQKNFMWSDYASGSLDDRGASNNRRDPIWSLRFHYMGVEELTQQQFYNQPEPLPAPVSTNVDSIWVNTIEFSDNVISCSAYMQNEKARFGGGGFIHVDPASVPVRSIIFRNNNIFADSCAEQGIQALLRRFDWASNAKSDILPHIKNPVIIERNKVIVKNSISNIPPSRASVGIFVRITSLVVAQVWFQHNEVDVHIAMPNNKTAVGIRIFMAAEIGASANAPLAPASGVLEQILVINNTVTVQGTFTVLAIAFDAFVPVVIFDKNNIFIKIIEPLNGLKAIDPKARFLTGISCSTLAQLKGGFEGEGGPMPLMTKQFVDNFLKTNQPESFALLSKQDLIPWGDSVPTRNMFFVRVLTNNKIVVRCAENLADPIGVSNAIGLSAVQVIYNEADSGGRVQKIGLVSTVTNITNNICDIVLEDVATDVRAVVLGMPSDVKLQTIDPNVMNEGLFKLGPGFVALAQATGALDKLAAALPVDDPSSGDAGGVVFIVKNNISVSSNSESGVISGLSIEASSNLAYDTTFKMMANVFAFLAEATGNALLEPNHDAVKNLYSRNSFTGIIRDNNILAQCTEKGEGKKFYQQRAACSGMDLTFQDGIFKQSQKFDSYFQLTNNTVTVIESRFPGSSYKQVFQPPRALRVTQKKLISNVASDNTKTKVNVEGCKFYLKQGKLSYSTSPLQDGSVVQLINQSHFQVTLMKNPNPQIVNDGNGYTYYNSTSYFIPSIFSLQLGNRFSLTPQISFIALPAMSSSKLLLQIVFIDEVAAIMSPSSSQQQQQLLPTPVPSPTIHHHHKFIFDLLDQRPTSNDRIYFKNRPALFSVSKQYFYDFTTPQRSTSFPHLPSPFAARSEINVRKTDFYEADMKISTAPMSSSSEFASSEVCPSNNLIRFFVQTPEVNNNKLPWCDSASETNLPPPQCFFKTRCIRQECYQDSNIGTALPEKWSVTDNNHEDCSTQTKTLVQECDFVKFKLESEFENAPTRTSPTSRAVDPQIKKITIKFDLRVAKKKSEAEQQQDTILVDANGSLSSTTTTRISTTPPPQTTTTRGLTNDDDADANIFTKFVVIDPKSALEVVPVENAVPFIIVWANLRLGGKVLDVYVRGPTSRELSTSSSSSVVVTSAIPGNAETIAIAAKIRIKAQLSLVCAVPEYFDPDEKSLNDQQQQQNQPNSSTRYIFDGEIVGKEDTGLTTQEIRFPRPFGFVPDALVLGIASTSTATTALSTIFGGSGGISMSLATRRQLANTRIFECPISGQGSTSFPELEPLSPFDHPFQFGVGPHQNYALGGVIGAFLLYLIGVIAVYFFCIYKTHCAGKFSNPNNNNNNSDDDEVFDENETLNQVLQGMLNSGSGGRSIASSGFGILCFRFPAPILLWAGFPDTIFSFACLTIHGIFFAGTIAVTGSHDVVGSIIAVVVVVPLILFPIGYVLRKITPPEIFKTKYVKAIPGHLVLAGKELTKEKKKEEAKKNNNNKNDAQVGNAEERNGSDDDDDKDVDDDDDDGNDQSCGSSLKKLLLPLLGRRFYYKDIVKGSDFVERFASSFEESNPQAYLVLFADLLLTIVSAVLEGIPAVTDSTGCKIIALFRILIAASSFVLAVMTPYCISFLNGYVLTVNILGVSSIILQVIATFTNGDKETLFELADLFMFVILWLSLLPFIWMFAQYAVDPARKLKRIKRALAELFSKNKRKKKRAINENQEEQNNEERARELEDLKLLQNAKNTNFLGRSKFNNNTKSHLQQKQQPPKLEELLEDFSSPPQNKRKNREMSANKEEKGNSSRLRLEDEITTKKSATQQSELNSMFFIDAAARERARRGKLYKATIGSVATESGLPLRIGERSGSNRHRSKKKRGIDQNDL